MRFPRASGILLHPTSLPGPMGIGDLGPQAFRFVDFLADAGQSLWQVLPLGPTGYGNSPYACYSAFAGNPLLLSLERLVEDGLLSASDLELASPFPTESVDFDAVALFKDRLLNQAFQTFRREAGSAQRQAFVAWCEAPLARNWLEDYALFAALKRNQGGKPWLEWEGGLVDRNPSALHHASQALGEAIWFQRFLQWQFDVQWGAIRRYAHQKGIEIIGDIPIYVADDSADVWAHRELFHLDEAGRKKVVAGVPPDYFSETGQLWGNPLYRWDQADHTGYAWWLTRFQVLLAQVDRIRVDHFRGFDAYWEIPAGEKTAVRGRWVPGPGPRLFQAMEQSLGVLPILAEDLGIITPEVEALRDRFQFPGMKILQFAFGDTARNPYLPHNYDKNCVVYTGTHDNDTTRGWFDAMTDEAKKNIALYLELKPDDNVVWELIRAAQASVADTCILPLQDVLELPSGARMNTPSEPDGNWHWRFQDGDMTAALATRLRSMAELYGRAPSRPSASAQ